MMMANRRLFGVTIGAAVLLVVVWYFALLSPQNHKMAAAHQAQATAEQQASQLRSQVVQLNALVRQIPQDTKRLGTYSAAVPDDPQLDAALRDIQQSATSAGVSMSSLTPSGATSGSTAATYGGTPAIGVSIAATGSYNQLMTFVTDLNKMPRTLIVTALNVSGTGTSLSAQVSSYIFYAGQPTP